MNSRKSKTQKINFDATLLLKSLRGHADHLEHKKTLKMRVSNIALCNQAASEGAIILDRMEDVDACRQSR